MACLCGYGFYYSCAYVQDAPVLSSFVFQGTDETQQCRVCPLRRTRQFGTAVELCVLPEEEPRPDVLRRREVAVVHFVALKTAEAVCPEPGLTPAEDFP